MSDSDLDTDILEGIPPDEVSALMEWREQVRGTNISERTLLATDYLNHFNEIAMLIEMIPDMPMMLEECYLWEPKTYQEHFQESGFSDKELAIEAYNHVPSKFKQPLEDTIDQLQIVISFTIQKIAMSIDADDMDQLRVDCKSSVEMIYRLIQVINGIVHGSAEVLDQEEIDSHLSVV